MNPLVGASLIGGGAGMFDSLANRMFQSGDRKRLKRFASYLESQRGREVLSEAARERIMGYLNRAGAPNRNRMAGQVSQRLGLDSGVAQGEIARYGQAQEFGERAKLAEMGERMRFQRDTNIDQLVSRMYSQLAG